MNVTKTGKKFKITDDNKAEKPILQKHKGKKFIDLTAVEKDELLLALLQRNGMANKNGKIK